MTFYYTDNFLILHVANVGLPERLEALSVGIRDPFRKAFSCDSGPTPEWHEKM